MRARIQSLRGRLETIRSQESGLEKELALVSTDLELQEVQVKEAMAALALASDQAAQAQQRVSVLQQDLARAAGDLRRSLTALYVLGRHGYWRLFLQLKPDGNLLPAIRSLRFSSCATSQVVDKVKEAEAALVEQSAYLLARRQEVEAWHNGDQATRRDAAGRGPRAARRGAGPGGRRAAADRRRGRPPERQGDQAGALPQRPGGRRPGAAARQADPGLPRPARGALRRRGGARLRPRRDPRYQTEVPHHGIDFRTARGAKVQAIFPGEVIYAADFEGYGPMVVIHHPGKVFTLSAGLELLTVQKGDVLSLGDVVGTAADTLYFEIREGNEPQDPARWLR